MSTLRYVIDEAFVVQWFPVISLLLAQDEYYDLAIEILAFVASNLGRGTIIKWAEQWSVFTDLRQQLEQLPDYRIAWERGTKRSHDDIIDALLHYLRDDDEAEPEQSALVEALSEREIEVLRLVAEGKSNREIASELYLALGTVKTHIHNICGKLGAKNRTEATAIGREMGLL